MRLLRSLVHLIAAAPLVAVALSAAVANADSGPAGTPPPQWAANVGSWPSPNEGLANRRANLHTRIDSRNVATLKRRWTFELPYSGTFGAFTSTPIVARGVVYLEDPDSDVFALKLASGTLLWQLDYRSATPSGGPNGVAYGYGLLYGETADSVFALDPSSGRQVWIRKLATNPQDGIDMAPQLYDGKLLISTIPGNSTSFYTGGAYVTRHDLRDYDFQDSPILVTVLLHGRPTEAVIDAGKSGYVLAFRASDGTRLWTLALGKHNRYQSGPLPTTPVVYCPGSLGGVLTPMAEAHGILYVPWIDLCFKGSATGLVNGGPVPPVAGGLAAVDTQTGHIRWKRTFDTMNAAAATIANNIVFAATYDGTIYALSNNTGHVLWHTKTPAGINSFPAVTKTMLIVGAGAPTSSTKTSKGEIIAYSLPRSP